MITCYSPCLTVRFGEQRADALHAHRWDSYPAWINGGASDDIADA